MVRSTSSSANGTMPASHMTEVPATPEAPEFSEQYRCYMPTSASVAKEFYLHDDTSYRRGAVVFLLLQGIEQINRNNRSLHLTPPSLKDGWKSQFDSAIDIAEDYRRGGIAQALTGLSESLQKRLTALNERLAEIQRDHTLDPTACQSEIVRGKPCSGDGRIAWEKLQEKPFSRLCACCVALI